MWLDTCATITRIEEGRRPLDCGRALGVEFESLPHVQRLILRGFLRRMPAIGARRKPPPDIAWAVGGIDYARAVRDARQSD